MTDPTLVGLAALMGLVTYPTRVAAFLLPLDRLPPGAIGHLRLMGPASMAAVAAVALISPMLEAGGDTAAPLVVWLAGGVCVALVAWRRSLPAGVLGALLVVAAAPSG